MRPNWDTYFMQLAFMAATRSTCPRRQVGSVLVKDKHVISTGYNGSRPGEPHCTDDGCIIVDGSCKRTIHSEQNAIHLSSIDPRESTLYCTDFPCPDCAGKILSAGIVEIVYGREYRIRDESVRALVDNGVFFRLHTIGQ